MNKDYIRIFLTAAMLSIGAINYSPDFAAASPIHDTSAAGDTASMNSMCAADEKCLMERDSVGNTPLHHAALKGQIKAVKYLIMKKAAVNAKNMHGLTPMHMAAMSENKAARMEVVELLAANGAKIDEPSKHEATPLCVAACAGNLEVMELLIAAGAGLNSKSAGQSTILLEVVEAQHCADKYGAMKLLLEKGADPNIGDVNGFTPLQRAVTGLGTKEIDLLIDMKADVNRANNDGLSPLAWAVYEKNAALVEHLVERGAAINAVLKGRFSRRTVAHDAAASKNTEIMKYLISKGADLKAIDNDCRTPLFYAAREGDLDMVKLMVENGASASVVNSRGDLPLSEAVAVGDIGTVEYLAGAGPRTAESSLLNAAIDSKKIELVRMCADMVADIDKAAPYGDQPILKAIRSNNIDFVIFLLERGARVEGVESFGVTPLHCAAKVGDERICVRIASLMKDIEPKDPEWKTPLIWAVNENRAANVKFLLSKGSAVEVIDRYGNTTLHHAANKCRKETIDILIAAGARVDDKNAKGETPLILAARAKNTDLAKAMLAKGARVSEADKKGNTALHYAAWCNQREMIDLLTAAGANLKAVNLEGKVPQIKPPEDFGPARDTMLDRAIKKAAEIGIE